MKNIIGHVNIESIFEFNSQYFYFFVDNGYALDESNRWNKSDFDFDTLVLKGLDLCHEMTLLHVFKTIPERFVQNRGGKRKVVQWKATAVNNFYIFRLFSYFTDILWVLGQVK